MNIEILYKHEVDNIGKKDDALIISFTNKDYKIAAKTVYNCAYAQINQILRRSGLKILPLQYECTEMAMLKVPNKLNTMAITVVDGPFFSLMPYPSEKLHTLSHVVHTKHFGWDYKRIAKMGDNDLKPQSNFKYMIQDSARYLPDLIYSEYVKSIFEIKTRALSFQNFKHKIPLLTTHEIDGLYSILGGKMDNVFELNTLFDLLNK